MNFRSTCILLACIGLTACGTVPKSREHFVELMKEETGIGPFKRMAFSKEVSRSFDDVFNNINKNIKRCVPEGYETVTATGSTIITETIRNNNRIEKVSVGKAEVTIQQHHSATVQQSEGGFYFLAADINRIDQTSVRIDFFTGKHYLSIAETIEHWANGSQECLDIGGN